MPKVAIDSVQQKIVDAAKLRGLSEKQAKILANYYLDANLRGADTHGVGRFLVVSDAIKTRGGPPQILKETSVVALVDGRRELGPLAAQYCVDLLIPKVKANGLGLVALRNASRYSHLTPFSAYIASFGFIGIVTNSAGPPAVAPHGSYAPILGTNPLCIAFPCAERDPIVLDFATSMAVWGEIRQAMLEERNLPPETFYTDEGAFAVRPADANAVRSFGGPKGYALCLAIEVLCGAFLGARMGSAVDDEYDLGFLFLGIDPLLFRDRLDDFHSELAGLAHEIRNSPAIDPRHPVRLPGDHSNRTKDLQQQAGVIELDKKTWDLLCQMAVDPSAGMESTSLTN